MPATLNISSRINAAAPDVAPPRRDHLVDLLRVLAISVVVLEHWLFPVLSYDATTEHLTAGNALSTSGAWITTWIGQVMPLVFFAGGAANAISWRQRRGGSAGRAWYVDRLRRLAWPVLPLAAIALPLPHILISLGVPAQPVDLAARLAGQLLWFLAAYLITVVATPIMLRLHERFGLAVITALGAAAAAVDVIRFAVAAPVGYLNLALVWLAVHQIGMLRSNGDLEQLRGRAAGWMALLGFGATAVLVAVGPYPASMIGLPGSAVSNANPPTIALLALGVGQIGLALALEPLLLRFAVRRRVARTLAWAAPRTMSIYLWHMPALAIVAGLTVVGVGLATPTPGGSVWWQSVPVWLAALVGTLGLILRAVARFERPPARAGVPATGAVAAAAGLIGGGLVGLTVLGFGQPLGSTLAVTAVALGLVVAGSERRLVTTRLSTAGRNIAVGGSIRSRTRRSAALTTGVGLSPPHVGLPVPWESWAVPTRLEP